MKLRSHIVASFSAGAAVGFFTKSLYAGLICFLFGILPDIDHIIEYLIHYGIKGFSLQKVYQASEETPKQQGELRFRRLYLIFHMWEIAILFWIAAIYIKNRYITAACAGYSLHMLMDYVGNTMSFSAYFMVGRALRRFETGRLFKQGSIRE